VGTGGVLLASLALRRDPVLRVTAAKGRFVFIDKMGEVAQFEPPNPESVADLDHLFRHRSPYDVSAGRLDPRELSK